jgi:hypothetical protein
MSVTQIGQASGTIEVAGDSDWFKVTLTAGTNYVFDVTGGSLSTAQVSLYDANGNLVLSGISGSDAEASFTATATGTYYVAAAGAGSATGSYNVHVSTTQFDHVGNTSTSATIAVGGTATSTLTAAGQSDWFKVSLSAGSQYVFTAAGAPSDVQVTIYDANGNAVTNSNLNGTVTGQVAAFEPTAGGTYYVGVSTTQGGGGAFTLSAATVPYDYAGNTTTTGTVSVGSHVSGTIAAAGQSDWFKVTLTAGTNYVFDVGGGSLTGGVELYDANGNLLVSGYNGGPSGGARTSYEPTSTGTYYVAASSFLSTTGTYTLGVSTSAFDYAGNTSTTGTLATNGHVSGTLAVTGQSDWFKVTLTAGNQYLFDVGAGTLTLPEVTVYDSTGKALSVGTQGGANGAAQVSFEPTTTGVYYVGASGQPSLSTPGTYTVSMSTAAYGFLGNVNTNGVLSVGSHSTGNLTSAGQSEWFKVSLAANTSYVFDISGALTNAQVALYDANGKLVSTGGTEVSIDTTAAGIYYVAAQSSSEGTGGFTLTAATATDDFANNTSTTGVIYPDYTAAAAVSAVAAGSLTTPFAVLDSAANVQANIDALAKLTNLHAVQFTDANTPTLTISGTQYANDGNVLADIVGSYSLKITGASVSQATVLAGLTNVTGFTVADSGANIGANFDQLQSLINTGLLTGISVNDGALIPITQAQYANDTGVLGDMTGNYLFSIGNLDVATALNDVAGSAHVGLVSIVDAAANIDANLDAIEGLASAGKLGTIANNDTSFVAMAITPTQLTNDAAVLNKLSGEFYLTIDGSAANLTLKGIAGVGNILDMSGLASQYSVTAAGDGVNFTLTDVSTGRTSTDHLSGITAIQFNDYINIVAATPGQGNVTTGNITELYGAVFSRQPDVPGLAFYLKYLQANPDTPLVQFAQYFLASPEYTSNTAHNYAHTQAGDDQFITDSYENLLHRAPETGAIPFYENVINSYTKGLAAGSAAYIAAENLGHAWVLTYFSASPEFLNDVQVTATHPADATHWLITI